MTHTILAMAGAAIVALAAGYVWGRAPNGPWWVGLAVAGAVVLVVGLLVMVLATRSPHGR